MVNVTVCSCTILLTAKKTYPQKSIMSLALVWWYILTCHTIYNMHFYVLFVCYIFITDQSALSVSSTMIKRDTNLNYYYYYIL